MACEFPVAVKAKLMLNCYTLFTLLLLYIRHWLQESGIGAIHKDVRKMCILYTLLAFVHFCLHLASTRDLVDVCMPIVYIVLSHCETFSGLHYLCPAEAVLRLKILLFHVYYYLDWAERQFLYL